MMVEFVGATGAGKSTLAGEARRHLAPEVDVVDARDLVAEKLGLRPLQHPTLRNLVADLGALPQLLLAWRRHRSYLAFVLRMLGRQGRVTLQTLNYLRSVVRKLGVYEIARRGASDRIVLVDEGTLHSAHLLFVYADSEFGAGDLARFAELVPLPDCVVHVKAPVQELAARTRLRPDPPRELRAGREGEVGGCLERACEVFDGVVAATAPKRPVLVVRNESDAAAEQMTAARQVAAFVLEQHGAGASAAPQLASPPLPVPTKSAS
jgi:hypothetical protein